MAIIICCFNMFSQNKGNQSISGVTINQNGNNNNYNNDSSTTTTTASGNKANATVSKPLLTSSKDLSESTYRNKNNDNVDSQLVIIPSSKNSKPKSTLTTTTSLKIPPNRSSKSAVTSKQTTSSTLSTSSTSSTSPTSSTSKPSKTSKTSKSSKTSKLSANNEKKKRISGVKYETKRIKLFKTMKRLNHAALMQTQLEYPDAHIIIDLKAFLNNHTSGQEMNLQNHCVDCSNSRCRFICVTCTMYYGFYTTVFLCHECVNNTCKPNTNLQFFKAINCRHVEERSNNKLSGFHSQSLSTDDDDDANGDVNVDANADANGNVNADDDVDAWWDSFDFI